MRAIAPGYYRNMKLMLDYFGLQYEVQRFLFAFSSRSKAGEELPPYYVHPSGRHGLPPRPRHVGILGFAMQIIYLAGCYLWLTICCFLVTPGSQESLGVYLRRIWIPEYFTSHYLLPLISSVATCSHYELLQSPAQDFVVYKTQMLNSDNFCLTNGIQDVQQTLAKGIKVRLQTEIEEVKTMNGKVRLKWNSGDTLNRKSSTQSFEHVVLACSPDVVARLYEPLHGVMSRIPTRVIRSFLLQPEDMHSRLSIVPRDSNLEADSHPSSKRNMRGAHLVSLSTHTNSAPWTETQQLFNSGARVAIDASHSTDSPSVMGHASFTRVLRTVKSRQLTSELFDPVTTPRKEASNSGWKNGDDNVWLAGAWCWDGMVLLEGCVVSAQRIARELGVDILWELPVRPKQSF